MLRVHTFDEWIDLFKSWQTDIGLEAGEIRNFKFDVKFGGECSQFDGGKYIDRRELKSAIARALRFMGCRVRTGGASSVDEASGVSTLTESESPA